MILRHTSVRASTRRKRSPLPARAAMLLTVGVSAWVTLSGAARAQSRDMVPSLAYRAGFPDFYDGQYRDALDLFSDAGRGAIKTGQFRWIDSICYETMVGECYYHMGHLQQALDHYTAALKLYVAFPDWMLRVQFPPMIRPSANATRIPWGASSRRSRLGHYPAEMLIGLGHINVKRQVEQGGVVELPRMRSIQVQEIVRCTTLAIRRRAELLGPVCPHDPLTGQLIAALSRRPGPHNHWSECWIDVQLGLALLAGGKEAQALPYLQRCLLAAGEFDHPLTSTALLELGRLALKRGDYPAASKFFEEATYAAVYYPDAAVLEEAFRGAALTHLLSNRRGVYPPLAAAIQWAKMKDLRQLHTSLLLSAAENQAVFGQTRDAAALLDDARLSIGRRQMAAGRIGSRLGFLSALVLFQQKKIVEGNNALGAALNYMRQGSHWLFHISLADGLYAQGAVTPRAAMDLYNRVLREPQPTDWTLQPMESLATLVTPHPGPIEHWFEVALARREHETALEIADRARRHRFFSSLAFGGRLQSLRWILEGPSPALDQPSQLLRQDLLTRYPLFDRLAQQARALRAKLDAMPVVVEDTAALKTQNQDLAQLAAVSLQQEALLREMAVRREPAGLVFPPLRSTKEIQRALPDGHAVLVFFVTSRHLYGFLLNNEQYTYWQVGSPARLWQEMVGLLRQMGHYQQNHELALKDLADEGWKPSAQKILDDVLKGSRADFTQAFDELAVVPDGMLWYLPFEALQVKVQGQSRPLIAKFRIRYAPTASLAVPTGRGRAPTGNTVVVTGELFPRHDDSVARTAFDQLAAVLPGSVALKAPLPAPSAVYAAVFDRLIVFDDLNLSEQGPYGWAPVPIDRGKPGNSLDDWLPLPWQGPEEIILPGYHTAAENSLKDVNRAVAGNEVFLSVCGLMSSGGQTLLLSRWRTGGQTSFDLVREFAQELPHTSPADAWQRAVFLVAGSRLNLEAEPRVKRTNTDETPKAKHPFFWAGYMLVDSGTPPQKPEPEPDEPVLKLKKPDQPQLERNRPGEADRPQLKLVEPEEPAGKKP